MYLSMYTMQSRKVANLALSRGTTAAVVAAARGTVAVAARSVAARGTVAAAAAAAAGWRSVGL